MSSQKQQDAGFDPDQNKKNSKEKDNEDVEAMPNENIVTEDICKSEMNVQSPDKADRLEAQQREEPKDSKP